jgi:hypothetical protein
MFDLETITEVAESRKGYHSNLEPPLEALSANHNTTLVGRVVLVPSNMDLEIWCGICRKCATFVEVIFL